MIKVMLVDDQNLVRKGVRSLLELSEEIEVIAEAPDGIEAIRTIPEIGPDVVLLDMRMPGKSGLDVLQTLSSNGTLPPTIIACWYQGRCQGLPVKGCQPGGAGGCNKNGFSRRINGQAGSYPTAAQRSGKHAY